MKPTIKPSDLILRCYAERERDGSWFAICVDLNLYARGDDFQEVRSKLNALVSSYIREALEDDAEYIADLVPRRAPLYFWARYYMIMVMDHIINGLTSSQEFKLPIPLVPAH